MMSCHKYKVKSPSLAHFRGVVLQRLDESGCGTMLEMLTKLCAGLESTKAQRKAALSVLQEKRDKIDQFATSTVSWDIGREIGSFCLKLTMDMGKLPG